MKPILAEKLIKHGVMVPGTEVEAVFYVAGIDGNKTVLAKEAFEIVSTEIKDNGLIVFNLSHVIDGSKQKLYAQNIFRIDGMDPERFAEVYGIKPDGDKAATKPRRGRKPKHLKMMSS